MLSYLQTREINDTKRGHRRQERGEVEARLTFVVKKNKEKKKGTSKWCPMLWGLIKAAEWK